MKIGRTSPDPVAEPSAYQAMLLGLLGHDDPAAVQSATLTELTATATGSAASSRVPNC